MSHRSIERVCGFALAPFLGVALAALLGLPQPASAETCAESPLARRAGVLYSGGDSHEALPYTRIALTFAEQHCGAENPAIVALLTDLAAIHQDLEQYDAAEELLVRVIEIKQAALPPGEGDKPSAALPDMIIDLDNLAFVYGAQGKFTQAGKLFETVLAIAEQVVGADHIIVSQALRNLAENKRALGRYDEVSELLERAAVIEAKAADEIPSNWAAKLGLTEPEPQPQPVSFQTEDDTLLKLLAGDE
jgi:tetratricopeptide (TPR) repeat protein